MQTLHATYQKPTYQACLGVLVVEMNKCDRVVLLDGCQLSTSDFLKVAEAEYVSISLTQNFKFWVVVLGFNFSLTYCISW
jgi:hypothetical protein